MLLPKIHRSSLLPSICSQPSFKNILVKIVAQGGTIARCDGKRAEPNTTDGIMP